MLDANRFRQIGDYQVVFGDQDLEHAQASGLAMHMIRQGMPALGFDPRVRAF
jgi:hypothetical protein